MNDFYKPRTLSDEASTVWKSLYPFMRSKTNLDKDDKMAFTLLCETLGEVVTANRMLREDGYVMVTKTGYKQISPWVTIRNGAFDRALKLLDRFGLNPAARSKVKGEEKDVDLAGLLSSFDD